jgi:hypothetical protein
LRALWKRGEGDAARDHYQKTTRVEKGREEAGRKTGQAVRQQK